MRLRLSGDNPARAKRLAPTEWKALRELLRLRVSPDPNPIYVTPKEVEKILAEHEAGKRPYLTPEEAERICAEIVAAKRNPPPAAGQPGDVGDARRQGLE